MDEAKDGVPCADCDVIYPPVAMDWHHRDPDTKSFTIGASVNRSFEALAAEIEKCDLLCAVCHRIRHAARAEIFVPD